MARVFNGTSQRGSVAVDLSFTNRAAVSFWLWVDAFDNANRMAVEYTADWTTGNGFVVNPCHSGARFQYGMGHPTTPSVNAQNSRSIDRPGVATWHHCLFVWDRGLPASDKCSAYLNGKRELGTLETSAAVVSNFGAGNLNVACRNGSSSHLPGRMEDLALWAGNLPNASDAALLASGVSPSSFALSARPYAYWPMLHGSGAPAIGTRAITWANSPTTAGSPARLLSARSPVYAPGAFSLATLGAAIGGAGAPPPSGGSDGYRWRGAQRDRFRW